MPPPSGMPPPAGYPPAGVDPSQGAASWQQPQTGQWQGAPPPKKSMLSGKMLYVVIAVIAVVVVVVLAAVLLAGVGSNNSNSSSTAASTYAQSASSVNSFSNSYKGGGWKPWIVSGFDTSTSATSPPVNASAFNSIGGTKNGCTATLLVSVGSTFTVPAFSGNLSSGESPYWIYFLFNATGAFLVVTDVGGTVTPLLLEVCTGTSSISSLISAIPSTVVDSSVAVKTAWNAGGAALVAKDSSSSVSFSLTAGFSVAGVYSSPPTWTVTYQACNPSTTSTTAVATFSASINATSGALMPSGATNSTGPCTANAAIVGGSGSTGGGGSTTTTLSSDLTFGTPSSTGSAGSEAYSVSVASASSGLQWGNLNPSVETAAGKYVFLTTGNLTVTGSGGSAVAVYNFTSFTWTSGTTSAIATGQVAVLTSGSMDLTGDQLLLEEFVSPTGTVTISNL
jgi:hypothetical protein